MDEKEINLRDYLRVLNARKISILAFFILTVLLVIIITFAVTPQYKPSTKLLIKKNTSADITDGYTYNSFDPKFLETQFQLIKSAAVIEKVVQNLDTEKIYDAFFDKAQKDKTDIPLTQAHKAQQLEKIIVAGLEIDPVRNSRIVEISYLFNNP